MPIRNKEGKKRTGKKQKMLVGPTPREVRRGNQSRHPSVTWFGRPTLGFQEGNYQKRSYVETICEAAFVQ